MKPEIKSDDNKLYDNNKGNGDKYVLSRRVPPNQNGKVFEIAGGYPGLIPLSISKDGKQIFFMRTDRYWPDDKDKASMFYKFVIVPCFVDRFPPNFQATPINYLGFYEEGAATYHVFQVE